MFIRLLLIMSNCARSTSNTSSPALLDAVDHKLVMYNMYHFLFFIAFYDLGLDNKWPICRNNTKELEKC